MSKGASFYYVDTLGGGVEQRYSTWFYTVYSSGEGWGKEWRRACKSLCDYAWRFSVLRSKWMLKFTVPKGF